MGGERQAYEAGEGVKKQELREDQVGRMMRTNEPVSLSERARRVEHVGGTHGKGATDRLAAGGEKRAGCEERDIVFQGAIIQAFDWRPRPASTQPSHARVAHRPMDLASVPARLAEHKAR